MRALPLFPRESFQAKIQFCSTATGHRDKVSMVLFQIPKLASQQVEYFDNQLLAFYEGRRSNKFMFNVSHHLDPAMRTALAKHFNALNPKPFGNPPRDLIAAGKKIFEGGVPQRQRTSVRFLSRGRRQR